LTVSPEPVRKPELRYQLLPRKSDTTGGGGNAAVKYLQAVGEFPPGDVDELETWRTTPLSSLDPLNPRMVQVMAAYGQALTLAREGALMDYANWQSRVREKGIAALLPSLGKVRQLGNVIAVQARLDIKRHDWPAAHLRLQTGYALARHLGEGETLVESLVGIAVAQNMNRVLEDWISEPGAPNLYWPLANLPVPFNGMREPLSFERDFAYFTLPALREMRAGRYSAATWSLLSVQLADVNAGLGVVSGAGGPGGLLGAGLSAEGQRLAPAVTGIVLYPEAKRWLVAHGMKAAQVEAMPVAETLGRYFVESWEEATDGVYKWMGLPPAQAVAGMEEWRKEFNAEADAHRTNPLAMVLLPSLTRAVQTSVALDRRIGALRLVEAVRVFAAEKGTLPARLEELTLPLPVDPLGKGYTLRREEEAAAGGAGGGGVVVIEATPAGDAARTPAREVIRYEVRLRK
jgi:hypothetical protein